MKECTEDIKLMVRVRRSPDWLTVVWSEAFGTQVVAKSAVTPGEAAGADRIQRWHWSGDLHPSHNLLRDRILTRITLQDLILFRPYTADDTKKHLTLCQ